mmetsp:Transcript_10103/g.15963  ORF Transcript_10103/g.15963 Transcript_10103/m.15963 type:complete len:151 (-) Transcript_10103:385-837(-)
MSEGRCQKANEQHSVQLETIMVGISWVNRKHFTYATLIALARIIVLNTSEGISHAPGPIPILKNAKYNARPNTANPSLFAFPTNAKDTNINETDIPNNDTKNSGRRPLRSNKCPASTITTNLMMPRTMRIVVWAGRDLIPDSSRMNTRKY